MFLQKGFWIVFLLVLVFHMLEDILWAVIGRFTHTPINLILAGIVVWAMLTTILLYSAPIKKRWTDILKRSSLGKGAPTNMSCPPHHWLLEPAHGPQSRGVCRYCGESTVFSNRMPDAYDWEHGRQGAETVPENLKGPH